MKKPKSHIPLTLFAVLLILLIAGLAGANLWLLRTMYRKSLHVSAAGAVLDLGRMITGQLADHPTVRSPLHTPADWAEFNRLVHSIYRVENGLEYVSVTEGGVILYQKQMEALSPSMPSEPSTREYGNVRIGRSLLGVRDQAVPVITFTLPLAARDGARRSIQVAIRKDAVDRKEADAASALTAMFKVALITICVSFGMCVVLVAWLVSREIARQRDRREEEHLAFAGALADGIVHDFRNPLSSLKLDVQMLSKETAKVGAVRAERIGELSSRINRTIDRVDEMLREFLYISKPEAVSPEDVDLKVCIRDCLDLLAPRLERLGVKVATELAEEGAVIHGFPVGLKRALINILMNAEQASPPGGTIAVRYRRERGDAVIEVLDEGPGIPKAERRRIFGMFVSTRPGGIGLGLSLAKSAVEACGGTISAHDAPKGGACIVIRIPVRG